MLMDDIVHETNQSPEIIHVVSYSEGRFIASSKEIIESIKITKGMLFEYRKLNKPVSILMASTGTKLIL